MAGPPIKKLLRWVALSPVCVQPGAAERPGLSAAGNPPRGSPEHTGTGTIPVYLGAVVPPHHNNPLLYQILRGGRR